MAKPLIIRFCNHFQLNPRNGCWEWTGGLDRGYGQISAGGRGTKTHAHRVSWDLFRGSRNGLHVCHSCDNRRCVNPNHLFLGTNYDNVIDCVNKGKHCKGERQGSSKLREEDILHIRKIYTRKYTGDKTQQEIADMFGVCNQTISGIVNNKTWKHLTGENE